MTTQTLNLIQRDRRGHDPLTAISAVPPLHFLDDAPIPYVTSTGVGAAANPAVEAQLTRITGNPGRSRSLML